MINKLLYRITANMPCRLIDSHIECYYVGRLFGVTFYLHRFVSSDSELHIHNHPWTHGGAVVLSGSYTEERAIDICPTAGVSGCLTEKRRVRWFNRVDGNTFHRIHDAVPGTWTLFAHGERPANKGWGFLEHEYFVGYHDVTVFKPFQSARTEWWKTAPLGRDAGRVVLKTEKIQINRKKAFDDAKAWRQRND